jgi:hypothetical protein
MMFPKKIHDFVQKLFFHDFVQTLFFRISVSIIIFFLFSFSRFLFGKFIQKFYSPKACSINFFVIPICFWPCDQHKGPQATTTVWNPERE